MNTEISESNCKCFMGRILRLINVLNGYDEQIGNIINFSFIRKNLG